MYKLILITLVLFSNQTFAKSKCQYEWNSLKKVQDQLRQKSTERLRKKEHKKHNEYQNCRKGKNKSARKTASKVNLENLFYGKKQKQWLKYYKTPQSCKNPKTERKLKECIKQRDKKAYHFERVWNSKQR